MRAVPALLLVLATAVPAAAQTATHQQMWGERVKRVEAFRKQPPLNMALDVEAEVDINRNLAGFALFAYEQGLTHGLRGLEDARTDKQVGAPAGSGGATGLVSKGAVPAILGFAVEQGALTSTGDQTSTTLRGNAVGWLDLLRDQDLIDAYDDDSGLVRELRRLSYSLTFSAGGDSEPVSAERPDPEQLEEAAEEAAQQLTGYSVRATLIDQRDPRRADNRAAAAESMTGASANVLRATMLFDPVVTSPEYRAWLAETVSALLDPRDMTTEEIQRVLYARLEVLRLLMVARIPNFNDGVALLVNALRTFEGARGAYFERLQQRLLVAAEIVRDRRPEQPGSWTARLVAQGRIGKSAWDITGNFAATYQDEDTAMVPEPVDTGGWRDVQMALQLERPLGSCSCLDRGSGIGRPVLSFEYLGRWLYDNAVVTFAGHDFAVEEGWIHAAQAKVTIPVKGSGVKVPFSVSVANRTELIRETTVRAHFGLTFDLDVLAAAVRR
jgi:hypothetical protein